MPILTFQWYLLNIVWCIYSRNFLGTASLCIIFLICFIIDFAIDCVCNKLFLLSITTWTVFSFSIESYFVFNESFLLFYYIDFNQCHFGFCYYKWGSIQLSLEREGNTVPESINPMATLPGVWTWLAHLPAVWVSVP